MKKTKYNIGDRVKFLNISGKIREGTVVKTEYTTGPFIGIKGDLTGHIYPTIAEEILDKIE